MKFAGKNAIPLLVMAAVAAISTVCGQNLVFLMEVGLNMKWVFFFFCFGGFTWRNTQNLKGNLGCFN